MVRLHRRRAAKQDAESASGLAPHDWRRMTHLMSTVNEPPTPPQRMVTYLRLVRPITRPRYGAGAVRLEAEHTAARHEKVRAMNRKSLGVRLGVASGHGKLYLR